MKKRPLQITMAVLCAIPVVTGIVGMFGVNDPLYSSAGLPANALVDSNLRFFGGLWLGLGLAMYYWVIPNIEKQTILFRAFWGAIFLGGVGRLVSMIFLARPPAPFIAFTALELVGAPVFIAWQARVAKAST
jgi:predicted membrane channel-forming protein YqfA (hemolysin III family)